VTGFIFFHVFFFFFTPNPFELIPALDLMDVDDEESRSHTLMGIHPKGVHH
jgi:hypothetical protein